MSLALGVVHPDELLTRMSSRQLAEWQAYAELEPFGSHFDDLRAGAVAAATYNVHRDSAQRPQPFLPLDFMPWNSLASIEDTPPVLGAELDPEQLSQLIDAQMFGKCH